MKKILDNIKIIVIALILSLGISYANAGLWQEPTGTGNPPVAPEGSLPTPLNVSDTDQVREGNIVIDSEHKLTAQGFDLSGVSIVEWQDLCDSPLTIKDKIKCTNP